jgi:hypothetical protein
LPSTIFNDKQYINKLENNLADIITNYYKSIEKNIHITPDKYKLLFNNIPKEQLNCSFTDIMLMNKVNLIDIDIKTILKNITDLVFIGPQNITGGVLKFLQLKAKIRFIGLNKSGNNPPWIQILEKHLAGDRDILACQEELLEAGLKDYAKL